MRIEGQVDLWDVLNEYYAIANTLYCVQMYIYDVVKGGEVYEECYEIVKCMNGGVYVREVVGDVA